MADFRKMTEEARAWMESPRFEGITRLHSARQVAQQQGTIDQDYTVARRAAEDFYARLRELFAEHRSITTFGPYSPGQAVTMKRLGIEGIYLGGWATSAKGSIREDPGADLASYPLSQVPDEAAPIVRALLAADKNQHFARSRMTDAERKAHPAADYRPFIIADADTGHGGDAHVRNLIRRFVEAGVPGYHIEDQKPGLKKCGHQGGKVLVSVDEQIKRLNAARFQLDVMRVPGIIVARTDAESASLLDNRNDERDQPFILGATNVELPSYKICYVTILRKLAAMGVDEVLGHHLFSLSDEEERRASDWLERTGLIKMIEAAVDRYKKSEDGAVEPVLDTVVSRFLEAWEAEAGIKTFARAVADVMEFGVGEGQSYDMSVDEWLTFAGSASTFTARERAKAMGIQIIWSSLAAVTPEGFFQVGSGIDYAIAKSLAVAPFCDILWMETKTANLDDAAEFAEAIHARYPNQMLAYNLSPSFNWDTTGMNDEEMRRFPTELGKLGYVFNFITYGGHQIDGLAAEDFATALKDDGMLALARLQRKFRLVDSPYRTPQTLVGGPRLDGALMASSGRTATTKSMGKGSTQFQHLVQTEVPRQLLEGWLEEWRTHYDLAGPLTVKLRPHTAGADLLELSVKRGDDAVANVVFASMQDRRGSKFLSVRDQNTFEEELRRKRLMSLVHLFLIHRYKAASVHYVSPTEDNQYQAEKMKEHGLYTEVHTEIGHMIVATVNSERVSTLIDPESDALRKLIHKEDPPSSQPRGSKK